MQQTPGPGEARTEQINALKPGMSHRKVLKKLGPPRAVLPAGPNERTEDLDAGLAFDDHVIDEVWEYGHPVRTRLTFRLCFRKAKLLVVLRESITEERAAQVERLKTEQERSD